MKTQTSGESQEVPEATESSTALHGVPERIEELDGIRGFAVLLVLFHHLSQGNPAATGSRSLGIWLAVTHAGWLGVDVFFALSGFLITRVLLGTKGRPRYYRNFYMRRILRLAPPYVITLFLVAVFIPNSKYFLLLSAVYLANFSLQFGIPMVYGPLWSLAVEEHFYLIWPWLVRFIRLRTLFILALSIAILSPLIRLFALQHGFFHPYQSWFRFDGLLWGATLAILLSSSGVTRKQIWIWSTAVGTIGIVSFVIGAALGGMARASVAGSTLSFGVVAMATTGLIGYAALGIAPRTLAVLRNPVLRFFGDISYWVYLFHYLAIDLIRRLVPTWGSDWAGYLKVTIIALSASIITGIAVRRWIELPVLSLKSRFR